MVRGDIYIYLYIERERVRGEVRTWVCEKGKEHFCQCRCVCVCMRAGHGSQTLESFPQRERGMGLRV